MKQAKLIEQGKLQEILPDNIDLEELATSGHTHTITLRIIPAPDFVGEIGKVYTEGVDYKLQCQHLGYWIDYNPISMKKKTRIIAIPIKQVESEDEATFHQIRDEAQKAYAKFSTFKNAAAWHTWKQAFHLGHEFSITRKKQ